MTTFSLLPLVVVFLSCTSGVFACLEKCSCYRNRLTWSNTMDCSQSGFKEIPSPLDPNINEFRMNDNFIKEVPSGSFTGASYVRIVTLSSNLIEHVANDGLSGLTNLRELRLTANRISDISFLSGQQMPLLESLLLNLNPISTIPPSVFESYVNLVQFSLTEGNLHDLSDARIPGQFISLSENPLTRIGNAAFARPHDIDSLLLTHCSLRNLTYIGNLTALRRLWVNKNQISHIDETFFNSLPSLGEIDLSDNEITDVLPFKNSPKLHTLDLSGNAISHIPSNSFQNLPELEVLNLRFNRISVYTIPIHVHTSLLLNGNYLTEFDGNSLNLTSVRVINLSNNQDLQNVTVVGAVHLGSMYITDCAIRNIEIIGAGYNDLRYILANGNDMRSLSSFHDFPKLYYLNLGGNSIASLGEGGLIGLPELISLQLSYNLFVSIPVFPELPALRLLDLSYNQIETLSVESFASLPSLEELVLTGNSIQTIPAFSNIQALSTLDLSGNPIVDLEENPFEQLSSLTKLDMINCSLTSISSLGRMVSLRRLNLEQNNISELDVGFLSSLPNLQTLNLARNEINHVPATLPSPLLYLNLSRNAISTIDSFAFVQSDSAYTLDISYNMVSSLDFLGYFSSSSIWLKADSNRIRDFPITGISENVRYLSVAENEITDLSPFTFALATRLYWLSLSKNRIRHIPAYSFLGCSSLSSLRLSDNPLESIESEAFSGLDALNFIKMNNIPLQSFPANLFDNIPNLYYAQMNNFSVFKDTNTPVSLHLPSLLSVTLDNQHMVTLPNISSPDLQYITISNCHLTKVPKEFFTRHPYLMTLHVSHNRISTISAGDFENAFKLFYLYLDDNQITRVAPSSFKPFWSIHFISLQNNNLTHLDLDMLYTNALINLDVSNNPWHCDCRIESLQRTLIRLDYVSNPAHCVSPPGLSSTPITSLQISELGCMDGNMSTVVDDVVNNIYEIVTETVYEVVTEVVTDEFVTEEVVELFTFVWEEGSGMGDGRAGGRGEVGPSYEEDDDDNGGGQDDGDDDYDVEGVTVPAMITSTRGNGKTSEPIEWNPPCPDGLPICSSCIYRAPSLLILMAVLITVFAQEAF